MRGHNMEEMKREPKGALQMFIASLKANPLQILFIVLIIALIVYPVVLMTASELFRVKLWQPFNINPHATILSSPQFSSMKEISPREIQKLLDKHFYDRHYEKDVFDCSNMSQETARYLQEEHGYDTSVVGDSLNKHAWVYVWTDKNKAWAIETASETTLFRGSAGVGSAGEIVGDDWWDIITQGHWLDAQFITKGYEFYYPTTIRKGLKVMEWNELEKYGIR